MRRRDFSTRDRRHVENLTMDICRMLGLNPKEPDYKNIGWETFLEVHRNQPGAFRGSGRRGWSAVAKITHERLTREKDALYFAM